MSFAQELREARQAAGLSQAQLARRAGTSQSRVSSYEAGTVTPSAATSRRLLAAARPLPSASLDRHRGAVQRLARHHKLGNVRVFGSVAHGNDTRRSDIDLLVTPAPEASLFDLSAFAVEAETLLGSRVDVMSDRGLDPASAIARDALPL